MHGILYFVNFALTGSKLFVSRNRGRHIAGIARFNFRTRINQEQITRFHEIAVIMIVQRLSVDSSDSGKRKFAVISLRYPVHFGYHFILVHPRAEYLHRCDMHIGRHVARLFYFYDFFRRFIITLCDYGTDKRHRAFLTCRRYPQPIH